MLRVKYLLVILASLIECIDDLVLQDIETEQLKFLRTLSSCVAKNAPAGASDPKDSKVVKLVPFDIMLSSQDWGTKWAEVLKTSTTFDGLLAQCTKFVDVPKDTEGGAQGQGNGDAASGTLQRFKLAVRTQEPVPAGVLSICSKTIIYVATANYKYSAVNSVTQVLGELRTETC